MRRLIGISLASFTISACAIGWGAAHPGFSAGHRSVQHGNRDHCCSHVRLTKTRFVGKASSRSLLAIFGRFVETPISDVQPTPQVGNASRESQRRRGYPVALM
jgi:hypothetical protein